jgi:prepilin-type N-terminal cleavage/methylation domain-containing protein
MLKNIMNNQYKTGQKGFTLVETIVIVVIIGILASIATPLYRGYINQQKQKQVDDIAESVAAAANGFVRQYPDEELTSQKLDLFSIDRDRFKIIIGGDENPGQLQVIDTTAGEKSDWIYSKWVVYTSDD